MLSITVLVTCTLATYRQNQRCPRDRYPILAVSASRTHLSPKRRGKASSTYRVDLADLPRVLRT
jgi:hypothetical protein